MFQRYGHNTIMGLMPRGTITNWFSEAEKNSRISADNESAFSFPVFF